MNLGRSEGLEITNKPPNIIFDVSVLHPDQGGVSMEGFGVETYECCVERLKQAFVMIPYHCSDVDYIQRHICSESEWLAYVDVVERSPVEESE